MHLQRIGLDNQARARTLGVRAVTRGGVPLSAHRLPGLLIYGLPLSAEVSLDHWERPGAGAHAEGWGSGWSRMGTDALMRVAPTYCVVALDVWKGPR